MANILISACLIGHKVRYNAQHKAEYDDVFALLTSEHNVYHFCPEVAAGLPIPRAPAEIQTGGGREVLNGKASVITADSKDVSNEFLQGAQLTLAYCQAHGIKHAILTESSPSCGSQETYNGEFSGTKVKGQGVTTALLRQHGIEVYNQFDIQSLLTKISA